MTEFDHPAWLTAVGTAGGYVLLLAVVTLVLFLLPYLFFVWL